MARYDDYDDASYREGFRARLAGKEATDVPYRKMTKKWFNWLDGWSGARQYRLVWPPRGQE